MGEGPLDRRPGEAAGLAVEGGERDRRSEGQAEEEDAAELEVVDQAEEVGDEVGVADPVEGRAPSPGFSPG